MSSATQASGSNRVVIEATIESMGRPRYTPAGLPAIDVVLAHRSEQTEAGAMRQVNLSLKAVAIGVVAESLQHAELQQPREFHGFLAARRQGSNSVVLHITEVAAPADPAAGRPRPSTTDSTI